MLTGYIEEALKRAKTYLSPNPHRKAISVDLLVKILNHAGIIREEWLHN